MILFLELAFLFAIGSTCGWVGELFYRRIVNGVTEEGKWVNPGFLVGPCLPLYGICLVVGYNISAFIAPVMPAGLFGKFLAFVIMAVIITVIEYITGLIFIVGMKVKLWDYTNEWGNIKGIICPKYTLIWLSLAAIYYFFVHSHITGMLEWFAKNLAFSFVLGFFYGIFVLDLVYSFRIVYKVTKFARDTKITVHYDEFRSNMNELRVLKEHKPQFFFTLRADVPISVALKDYSMKLKKVSGEEYMEKFDEYRKELKSYNEEKIKLQIETMGDLIKGVKEVEKNIEAEIKKKAKGKK
ncbi:MAG: putative ABC transporter permease [Lachnospiraceae bacterium]|nr:putative ABC transporter permease [Lachnospiraceae bacterium]